MTTYNTTTHGSGSVPPKCVDCGSSGCARGMEPIYADNNSVGRGIFRYVPELAALEQPVLGDVAEYSAPNLNRGPIGMTLKAGLAQLEGVDSAALAVDGSGLARIKELPAILEARSVVVLENDFFGYSEAARVNGLDLVTIPVPLWGPIDRKKARKLLAAQKAPIVYLTTPFTNPGQTPVSLELVQFMLDANPKAYVVIDAAYRRAIANPENYAAFALEHDRVIYLNVAAKDLGACGARVSWMVARPKTLDRIKNHLDPYSTPTPTARYLGRLLGQPDLLARIHDVQAGATSIYWQGFSRLGLKMRAGQAPWVLVDMGKFADEFVHEMLSSHSIRVQDQSAKFDGLDGWVRISSTVPCEARRVVAAVERYLGPDQLAA